MRKCSAKYLCFLVLLVGLQCSHAGCVFFHGQQYADFITPTPLGRKAILVLGFMGGRDRWNHPKQGVRRLALKLRCMKMPGVHVETIENKERQLGIQLIQRALDRNLNGRLDPEERSDAHIILYGQSFGGAAVLKVARSLDRLGVPVRLTVQVDSVGRKDALVPPNVSRAANLFQTDGLLIQGERRIRAQDSSRTTIIGNFRYRYRDKRIDLDKVSWLKKLFRVAHTKMNFDPEVWLKVEDLVLQSIRSDRVPGKTSALPPGTHPR